jgi:hypothetical protein
MAPDVPSSFGGRREREPVVNSAEMLPVAAFLQASIGGRVQGPSTVILWGGPFLWATDAGWSAIEE